MCAGKDELKPHLHYASTVRFAADRISSVAGVSVAEVLRLSSLVGFTALLDEALERCDSQQVNGMALAKVLSTRSFLNMAYDEERSNALKIMDQLRVALLSPRG